MSRIYDALEYARREGIGQTARPSAPARPLPAGPGKSGVDMEQEMISLYQLIEASLPLVEHPSVLFVGSRSNEGTSTVARELARVAALRLEKTVLLIDLDRSRPDLHVYSGLSPEAGGEGVSADPAEPPERSLCRFEDSSLYVMPLFQKTLVTPRTLDNVKDTVFWEPLKKRFDLIIVDSPPATTFPDGPGIVSHVDGVIIVVEAEKTRWQVALSVKQKVLKHGGNILGVVFNKRRYYIPSFIYRHL
jgi:Mrp family chromosome partitioning ATPase